MEVRIVSKSDEIHWPRNWSLLHCKEYMRDKGTNRADFKNGLCRVDRTSSLVVAGLSIDMFPLNERLGRQATK